MKRDAEVQRFAKLAVANARKKWGPAGWGRLTPETREAFVASELILLMLAQHNAEQQTIAEWEPICIAAFNQVNPDR